MVKGERKSSSSKEEQTNDSNNIISKREKKKRNRRKNGEIEKSFLCELCKKRYSAKSVLINHKKDKHNCGINNDPNYIPNQRGRPSANENLLKETLKAQRKYKSFFDDIERKKPDSNKNDKITLDDVKKNISDFFDLYSSYVNKNINKEEYPLSKLIINNWNKEIIKSMSKSFLEDTEKKNIKENESPCIDELFYLYLKEFSNETNKKYFYFMIKFVFFFREFINDFKKNIFWTYKIKENGKEYTELFNGVHIPELCNDFCLMFMEKNYYFSLIKEELIDIIQHFCYWLYDNRYSASHLTLLN